jgi:hypothetical protein
MSMLLLQRLTPSVAVLGLVVLLTACHNPDRYVLTSEESPAIDGLFTLAADGDTVLPADGFSSVELVARVHDVSEGAPSIRFTTSAGQLRLGAPTDMERAIARGDSAAAGSDTVTVPADDQGVARIHLVSVPTAATAQVRAEIVDVEPVLHQTLTVRFEAVDDAGVLTFVAPPDSAFAHGFALVPITVQLHADLAGEDRTIRFETTDGVFPFGSGSESQTQLVRADLAGVATAHLRTPEEPGEALIRATVGTFFQETTIRFVPVPADSVLSFVAIPEQVLADGQSLSRVEVRISPRLRGDEDRSVEFETTAGSFALAGEDSPRTTVRADADGVAVAYLRSPSLFEEALVQASVKGFTRQRMVQFEWAGPDSIVVGLEWDEAGLRATGQMEVEAQLIRLDGRGQVTQGLEVSFDVVDSLGVVIPRVRFVNTTVTDSSGKSRGLLVASNTTYRGRALISVRPARLASTVVGQEEVQVIDR